MTAGLATRGTGLSSVVLAKDDSPASSDPKAPGLAWRIFALGAMTCWIEKVRDRPEAVALLRRI
jgi:hypothetical protein